MVGHFDAKNVETSMNPAALLFRDLGRASFTRSMISPMEWAETKRRMRGGVRYSMRGRFCYQREPYEEIFNPDVDTLVLAMASRLGKTALVTNAIGYFIGERPQRIVFGRPSQASANNYSKDEFQGGLIDPTSQLAKILPSGAGRRLGNNTIEAKEFPGGKIQFCGVNSGGMLRIVHRHHLFDLPFWPVFDDDLDRIQNGHTTRRRLVEIFAQRVL